MLKQIFRLFVITSHQMRIAASMTLLAILVGSPMLVTVSLTRAGSLDPVSASCNGADELGGRAHSEVRYRAFSNRERIEIWMTFPCGQTAKHEEYVSGAINPVLPCDKSPELICFQNRLPSASATTPRSDVFFALPRNFRGGSAKWGVAGVEFQAIPISNRGDEDLSNIVAHRVVGVEMPQRQEFIFSVKHGLLAATTHDERTPGTQVYLLVQRTGLFASIAPAPPDR
jgi:hypothetical protein